MNTTKAFALEDSLANLAYDFPRLNWNYRLDPSGKTQELVSYWLGDSAEQIMVCVFRGSHIDEPFHRQDFFFFNFAYQGGFRALSARYDHFIDVREGDCYIGQPFSGYALKRDGKEEITILGILIKKELFYREFLQVLSSDSILLHFFLDPIKDQFSDEYLHISLKDQPLIWSLLETMVLEYAYKKEDTQALLISLTQTLSLLIAREIRSMDPGSLPVSPCDRMVQFIRTHSDTVTLTDLSEAFGYHPAYISSLLSKQTGKTFSQLLLEVRMERAVLLLSGTDLRIEEIAVMLGYSNNSNFYKAFKSYYRCSPREYA